MIKKNPQFEIWSFSYFCFICHYDYTFNVYSLINKIESFLYEMINWIFFFTCVGKFWYKIVISTYCYVVDLLFIHNITSGNNIKLVLTLKRILHHICILDFNSLHGFCGTFFCMIANLQDHKKNIYRHNMRHFFYSQKHVCTWTNTLEFHTHTKRHTQTSFKWKF
jgi:hypothetical protein